jgi:8-oxo-dGTP pyrophosphatase MutT (NUDIX family)
MAMKRVAGLLETYAARYPQEVDVIEATRMLLRDEPRCFERTCWRGHITGSAWLVDATERRVLLTHHRKLGRWLQLGGHSDGDTDPLRVACREAEEESGLKVAAVSSELFDLDIHEIPARSSDPAHYHFDLRFALRVVGSEQFSVSDESHALAWVEIAALETVTEEPSMLRMAQKWRAFVSAGGAEAPPTGVPGVPRKRPTTDR